MKHILIAFCLLAASPALACERPTDFIARAPVPAEAMADHGAAFDTCWEALMARMPEDRHADIVNDVMDLAVRGGDQVVTAKMLASGARNDRAREGDIFTYLHRAALDGHAEIARLLLEAGADADGATEKDGPSPLTLAFRERHAEVARVLHEAGGAVRLHPNDPEGITLMELARYGVRAGGPTFALLIEIGEDPNAPYLDGTLPIHTAAALGEGDVIHALVAGGANLFATDRQQHTPLITAAGTNNGLAALPALMDLGATATAEALREAELNGKDANAAWLRAIGDPQAQQDILNQAMFDWAQTIRADNLPELIRAGAEPNATTGARHIINVLGCAPRPGFRLLAAGADPDAALIDGAVPDWAADCATADFPDTEAYIRALGWLN